MTAGGVPSDGSGASVAGHTEAELLSRIVPRLPSAPSALLGPGDDAAVVAAPDGRVVVTTDVLVEGEDFRRDWSSGADVGWKAAMQNLADVAAMGAVPSGLVVGLSMPGELAVAWVEDFAEGLAAACRAAGTGVVGGDLSASPVVVVSVTAFGDLQGRLPVRRDGARPGDVLALAGRVGWAAAGLDLLSARALSVPSSLDEDLRTMVEAQRRPLPPLASGPAAAVAGVHAMLDVSDGIGLDAQRLADASGVDLDIDAAWLGRAEGPLRAAARHLRRQGLAREWVLGGGEDHALLAAFPSSGDLPPGFDVIGRVEVVAGRPRVRCAGVDVRAGWEHFSRGDRL